MPKLHCAAIGLDHQHIYDQVKSLLDIGAAFGGFWTDGDPQPLMGFIERFPHIPRVADRRRLIEDPSIHLITCAAIPCERADNVAHPDDPGFEDLGEVMIESDKAAGYFRVDWFTPEGLPTWGDGRLTIVGTEGTIELRKYIDLAGRPGIDHLFLVDRKGVRHIDCADADLPYYKNLHRDVFERTESAMPQSYGFKVCELALEAQALAEKTRSAARAL